MVVKIMRWRPWPPLVSRKFAVRLTVKRLEVFDWVNEGAEMDNGALAVEIRWKGPKISLSSFRRTVKRNCTREEIAKMVDGQNGVFFVEWDEEFQSVCSFSGYKDDVFHPWEINFTVFNGLNQGAKNKVPTFGSAAINLVEYLSMALEHNTVAKILLTAPDSAAVQREHSLLVISLSFLELKASQELTDMATMPSPSAHCLVEKNEVSALKSRLSRVKIFSEYVSTRKAKKPCREDDSDGRGSKSEGEYAYSCGSEADEEFEEGESEGKDSSAVRNSFSYGSLAFANYAGASLYSSAQMNGEDEDWIYYSNRRRSDEVSSCLESPDSSIVEEPVMFSCKRSILPWRKRKMSFRTKVKGEPLLKKAYGEEGGDDIDFDRRQLSSDESSLSFERQKTDEDSNGHHASISDFGDDHFAVGKWEQKEIISRDGEMKIKVDVFFASIDQRSERAAGESACTALVAVVADWLHKNQSHMPIKSQFDSLIRDGSLEWRKLCENQAYMECFPDKHFDLETIIQARIRDIRVVPEKSFVGFFDPDGNFEFLQGAMSFDSIWDEITGEAEAEGAVYIVSWNDHFFILKIDGESYYIIDTLGERLHEGCTQAYILKFDKKTTILKVPSDEKPACDESEGEEEVVCRGNETCKEYMKSFLASIPIRELRDDIEKGLVASTSIHARLQIEFHFTEMQEMIGEEGVDTGNCSVHFD